MSETFDALILGTGQAGPPLAKRLSDAGMRVAVVERHRFGGTCVNTGCIPTKAMVASAYAAHLARRAADFGVKIDGPVGVDLARVKARKDEISGRSREAVEKNLRELPNGAVYTGHARFVSPHEVSVGGQGLRAERVFLNVGTRAQVPPIPGLEGVPFLTNSSLLELDAVPPHLLILGGSYIGLEFGQMFRRFGSRVTILEKGPRLLGREDEEVSAAIRDILAGEGIDIRLDADCFEVGGEAGAITLGFDGPAGREEVSGSHLLLAVGRRPNTDDLGLEAARVAVDSHGFVQVNDRLETNVPGIWALGDCNGKGAFTHTSYNDYEIVAANLLDHGSRSIADRIPAYALYIDPPLGRAGLTEQQARQQGRTIRVGRRPMSRVGRAIEKGETQGLMKIVVDADTQEILGAAILGTGGDEAIHGILDTMYAKGSCDVLRQAMHIHPTVSELIPTMLGQLEPA